MSDALEPLICDLLEWLRPAARDYHEALEVWRTSCPHLPVWEEAHDRGLVERREHGGQTLVSVTDPGLSFLAAHRPSGSTPH